jgi:membrane protein YqaA with SNARE-associated domain
MKDLIYIISMVLMAAFSGGVITYVIMSFFYHRAMAREILGYEEHFKELKEETEFWKRWANKYKDLYKQAERTNTIIINDPDNFQNIKFGE